MKWKFMTLFFTKREYEMKRDDFTMDPSSNKWHLCHTHTGNGSILLHTAQDLKSAKTDPSATQKFQTDPFSGTGISNGSI